MIEVLKQMVEALENERQTYEAIDSEAGAPYNILEAIKAGKQAIAELESQETVALEALVMICVKCRSNEWGSDTPRKQILNWFHDTASKALECAEAIRARGQA